MIQPTTSGVKRPMIECSDFEDESNDGKELKKLRESSDFDESSDEDDDKDEKEIAWMSIMSIIELKETEEVDNVNTSGTLVGFQNVKETEKDSVLNLLLEDLEGNKIKLVVWGDNIKEFVKVAEPNLKVDLNKVRVEKISIRGQKYNQGDCNYQVTFVKGSQLVSHGMKDYIELKYLKIKDIEEVGLYHLINIRGLVKSIETKKSKKTDRSWKSIKLQQKNDSIEVVFWQEHWEKLNFEIKSKLLILNCQVSKHTQKNLTINNFTKIIQI